MPPNRTTLWKDIIHHHLPAFLALFLPVAYADIDWWHGYRRLDEALDAYQRETGLLLQVEGRDDEAVRLFIRIADERSDDVAHQMWLTHLSLYKRFGAMPVSMALLIDDDETWHPDSFGYDLLGKTLRFVYPTIKLMKYAENAAEAELNASANPLAILVLAYRAAHMPDADSQTRLATRRMLEERLYQLGYRAQAAPELFDGIRKMLTNDN